MNEESKKQREFRFQTEDAKGGSVKFHLFLEESMRCVITSKEGDGAVCDTFD